MTQRIPLACLHAFEAAARHESFSKAAAELSVSPASVSQHVRTLEGWLGRSLFRRLPRGVRLTSAGRELGIAVSLGFSQIEDALQHLRPSRRQSVISIGCIPSVMTRWLIPRLSSFRDKHPNFTVNLVYALDANSPEEGAVDLLIVHGKQPNVPAIALLSAATRPTCSTAFLEKHGPIKTPQSLATRELLHDETPAAWSRWFEAVGLKVRRSDGNVFADFNLLVGAVTAGMGVGLCPTALVSTELAQGSLSTLFDAATDIDKSYWLIEPRKLSRSALVVRDWLVAESQLRT
jgi:LysR family transcriptional regulator, glycine cleavage system transcriptional activator